MLEISYKKIVKDIGVIGFSDILSNFSGIFLIPIIIRILGVADYGLYVQFSISIVFIVGFAHLGLPYATVRFLSGSKNKEQIRDDMLSSLLLVLLSSVIISIIILLISQYLSRYLFDDFTEIAIVLAIIIPIECLSVTLQNTFRVFQEIKKFTLFKVIKIFGELFGIIIVIFLGYGVYGVVLVVLLVSTIICITLLIIVLKTIGLKRPTFKRMKEFLKFSIPTIPSNISSWVTNSSDRYLIGIFLGVLFVGFYNPAYSLGGLICTFTFPINFVLISVVAKYYDEQKIEEVRKILKYSLKYFLILAIPSFFGLSILSKPILILISTPELANESYLVTPFIAFSMILTGIGAVSIGKSLYLAKKTHISMINSFIVAIINLTLNIIMIPKFGILGAAFATAIAFLFGFIIGSYFSCKYFKFDIDWFSIIKIVSASMIMSIIIINYHPETIIGLLGTILTGFCIYVVLILLFRTISNEEIKFFKSFFNKNYN